MSIPLQCNIVIIYDTFLIEPLLNISDIIPIENIEPSHVFYCSHLASLDLVTTTWANFDMKSDCPNYPNIVLQSSVLVTLFCCC